MSRCGHLPERLTRRPLPDRRRGRRPLPVGGENSFLAPPPRGPTPSTDAKRCDWSRCRQVRCWPCSAVTTRTSPVCASPPTAATLCPEGRTTWRWSGAWPGSHAHRPGPATPTTSPPSPPPPPLVLCLSCSVVQLDLGHAPEPRHVLSRHTLPITDLHCGLMGAQARVATSSLDQTVKVTLNTCSTSSCSRPLCFLSVSTASCPSPRPHFLWACPGVGVVLG